MDNYSYPLDPDWTKAELLIVMAFLTQVETANESGVDKVAFLASYREFKTVVKSIGEEKKLDREFEQASGYSIYKTVQAARQTNKKRVKLTK